MPWTIPVAVSDASPRACEMPKSLISAEPSPAMRMFPGFTSRWTILSACAAASADATSAPMCAASVGVNGPCSRRSSESGVDSMSCITMQGCPSCSTTSKTVTAWGWWRPAVMRASRIARSVASWRSPSVSSGWVRSILSATGRRRPGVPGLPYDAHPARAQHLDEPIAVGDEGGRSTHRCAAPRTSREGYAACSGVRGGCAGRLLVEAELSTRRRRLAADPYPRQRTAPPDRSPPVCSRRVRAAARAGLDQSVELVELQESGSHRMRGDDPCAEPLGAGRVSAVDQERAHHRLAQRRHAHRSPRLARADRPAAGGRDVHGDDRALCPFGDGVDREVVEHAAVDEQPPVADDRREDHRKA